MGVRQVEKILVLADDNAVVAGSVFPDFVIGSVGQINVENVLTIDSARRKKACKRCGRLVIDQKLQMLAGLCGRFDGPRTQ